MHILCLIFNIMTVEINNRPVDVTPQCNTLALLLEKEGFTGIGQAVAVNNRVIPRGQWSQYQIKEGDKIIIIKALCGG